MQLVATLVGGLGSRGSSAVGGWLVRLSRNAKITLRLIAVDTMAEILAQVPCVFTSPLSFSLSLCCPVLFYPVLCCAVLSEAV